MPGKGKSVKETYSRHSRGIAQGLGKGVGLGKHGLSTAGPKRHRKVLRDNIQGVTKGSIR